jgi:hypothetical protein
MGPGPPPFKLSVFVRKEDKQKFAAKACAGWGNPGPGGSLLSDNRRPYAYDPPLMKAAKQTKAISADFHLNPQKRCLSCSVTRSSLPEELSLLF